MRSTGQSSRSELLMEGHWQAISTHFGSHDTVLCFRLGHCPRRAKSNENWETYQPSDEYFETFPLWRNQHLKSHSVICFAGALSQMNLMTTMSAQNYAGQETREDTEDSKAIGWCFLGWKLGYVSFCDFPHGMISYKSQMKLRGDSVWFHLRFREQNNKVNK